VEGLEGFELGQEDVETAEEFVDRVGVEVDDGGEGDAEKKVIGRAAGEFTTVKVGHAGEVGLVEEERVEPVDTAFMASRTRVC
jgi:hypothetical protein